MTLVSSKGKMFLYLFFALFSGFCPSFLLKRCLHSCCCKLSNSSQNPPYGQNIHFFKGNEREQNWYLLSIIVWLIYVMPYVLFENSSYSVTRRVEFKCQSTEVVSQKILKESEHTTYATCTSAHLTDSRKKQCFRSSLLKTRSPIQLLCSMLIRRVQCCGSRMFIPDPNFFYPGSGIRIFSNLDPRSASKNLII